MFKVLGFKYDMKGKHTHELNFVSNNSVYQLLIYSRAQIPSLLLVEEQEMFLGSDDT